MTVEAEELSPDVRNDLVQRFVDHLQQRPLDPGETLVLDLERGPETEIPRRDEGIERCPPVLANREEVVSLMAEAGGRIADFMDDAGDYDREARREMLLDVILDATGRVRKVMVATPSGNPYLNVQARGVGRQMEFEPTAVNGVPVAAWIQVPVNFRMPDPE